MLPQPGPRRSTARRKALNQTPETWPVVHLGQMSHLVGNNIIDHRFGSEDQPPAEGKVTLFRAAAPPAPGVAYADPCHLVSDTGGQMLGALRKLGPGHHGEVVAHAARQICRIAANSDFAVADPDRL